MTDMLDKLILLACCFIVFLLNPYTVESVVPILAAVIFSALISYLDKEKVRAALTLAAVVFSVVNPGMTVFLPLVCYDLLLGRFQFICLSALVPLILFWQSASLPVSLGTAMLFAISVYFKYQTTTKTKLVSEYKDMRDATKEMEIRLKQQNSDLMEKQDYEINIATLNERNRIAREIHDNVGHLLSSSILQVGALLAVNRDEKVRENLMVVKETLDEAMNSIRSSVHDLHDESVDLYAQVYGLVQKFTFCELDFDYDIKSSPDKKIKYAFISIVRESLSNIIRHSDASRASIRFREHPALYQLVISDNGTVKDYNVENGIGLKNITDRVNALDGVINISAKDGFQIFISVPKEELHS